LLLSLRLVFKHFLLRKPWRNALYRNKKFTSPKKVGRPEIGAAHKSQTPGPIGSAANGQTHAVCKLCCCDPCMEQTDRRTDRRPTDTYRQCQKRTVSRRKLTSIFELISLTVRTLLIRDRVLGDCPRPRQNSLALASKRRGRPRPRAASALT